MTTSYHLTKTDNLPNDYSIRQGEYYSWIIYYPEVDFTTWTFEGQIRSSPESETILAVFNFLTVTFGTVAGKTGNYSTIVPYLNASQTSLLPVTNNRKNNREKPIFGENVLVYDIEATDPLNPENVNKIIPLSYIEVVAEVTR